MTRDPLLRAADIRAATVNVRTNPGTDKGHLGNASEPFLRHARVEEAEREAARLGVCCLAIAAGCQRDVGVPCTDPGHDAPPRPAGEHETGHVAGVRRAWYALGLAEEPGIPPLRPYPGHGTHERERAKPGFPAG